MGYMGRKSLSRFFCRRASVLFNSRCSLTYFKGKNFSDSFLHHIFEFENFRFSFFYEKWPKLGIKYKKKKLRKS